MSKEDCQKHGGRGKWEGIGARLEGCSLPGCCGGQRGELASFPVLQWLLCLQSHPWAPVLVGVVSHLGTVQAACGCVAMF